MQRHVDAEQWRESFVQTDRRHAIVGERGGIGSGVAAYGIDAPISDSQKSVKTGVNHDLSLRLDLSLRRQASLSRDIATATSAANSGNTALRLSFVADYTLSRLLTLSA